MSLKTIKIPESQDPKIYDGCDLIDEDWRDWTPDREILMMQLRGVINHASQIKQVRGHIFLNELYDLLGLPRTYWGQIAGWWVTDFDAYVQETPSGKVWLTFNVEGDIHE